MLDDPSPKRPDASGKAIRTGVVTLDIHFHGIAAPLRLTGAEAVLPHLERIAAGWPFRQVPVNPTLEAVAPFFSISADADSGLLVCESHIEGKPPRRFDAVNAVCDAMVGLALALPAEHPQLICLHAAGVAMAGRLAIFPNVQRAGKSTLSAALARAGHPVFSDDVVPLAFDGDGRAQGLAMGIAPRLRLPLPESLPQGFRDWAECIGGTRNQQYQYLSLPDQLPHGVALPVGAFVILERRDAPIAARLEPVSPDVAMDALLFQNFTRDRHSGDILKVMAAMLSDLPVFRLTYYDLDGAVACLEGQFAGWPDDVPVASGERERTFRMADFRQRAAGSGPALRQRPGTTEVRLAERLYLADAEGRAIHRMDALAAAIWQALQEPTLQEELAEMTAEAFPDIDRSLITADLSRLLNHFADAGLTEATEV